jgi:hypothetical protein
MNNYTIIEEIVARTGEVVQHILIDRGNGEFTGMPKSTYDAMQAAQAAAETNYLTSPAIMELTQPDEADLTEGNN